MIGHMLTYLFGGVANISIQWSQVLYVLLQGLPALPFSLAWVTSDYIIYLRYELMTKQRCKRHCNKKGYMVKGDYLYTLPETNLAPENGWSEY